MAFVYDSATPALRLTWEWIARAHFGPIEHRITIENRSKEEMWLPLQLSFQFNWQVDPTIKLEHLYIDKGAGTPTQEGTHHEALPDGYAWNGLSSTYADGAPAEIIPWSLVENSENQRSGWYAGIEFSGCTRISLRREGGSVSGSAGLNPDPGPFHTRLGPGESFVTPTIFVGACRGGPDSAGNGLRRWVREVLGHPQTWTNPAYPLLVNNSWGSGMDVDEVVTKRMIRDSAELGFDMFHLDAGWFRGVGDWYPDAKKFSHGLAAVAEDAHQHGLKFGLWVDWTQAGLDNEKGALNARDATVRNWLTFDPPADWKPEAFKGITIDLGVPEAEGWARHEVERMVGDYHLDMLEHDGYLVAKRCDHADHPHAPAAPGAGSATGGLNANSSDVSYHSVRAYYEIYEKLRRDHPELLLEICNDGGRMVDFGSAAHGDYFSITDTYDPLSNRRAFYDASHVLPPAMLECYIEKWPAPNLANFRYMLRSGMMGWPTIMTDTTQWSPEQHDAAKVEFQFFKTQLRSFIRDADLYHISDRPDGIHWDGTEYFDPRRKAGVVFAFRGSMEKEASHSFLLEGLRDDSVYQVRFHDHSAADETLTGAALLHQGLKVSLPSVNSSELILLEEVTKE